MQKILYLSVDVDFIIPIQTHTTKTQIPISHEYDDYYYIRVEIKVETGTCCTLITGRELQ
jgi:hypothetical protein